MKKAEGRGRKSSVVREARPDYPWPSSAVATAVMRGNRKVDTRPEVLIRSLLHERGLRFRKHLEIRFAGGGVRPDIVFPGKRLAVFVDGCFWHRCPDHGTSPSTNSFYWEQKLRRNVERDRSVDRELGGAGWTVLRIWEHEDPRRAADRIAREIR